jgi:hypothetical protein
MTNVQHMINIQQTLCPWATRINAGPRSDKGGYPERYPGN